MYRVIYSREGFLRFVSHLDIVRLWQRALFRAKLPVKISRGFTPHPIISFGPPLPVGIKSLSEMLDFALSARMEANEIKKSLNSSSLESY